MADIKEIAETLVNLTVREVSELADVLKEEYGIEPAAAAVAVAAGPGGGGAEGGGAAEKTEFDVVLNSAGAAKTQNRKRGERSTWSWLERSEGNRRWCSWYHQRRC